MTRGRARAASAAYRLVLACAAGGARQENWPPCPSRFSALRPSRATLPLLLAQACWRRLWARGLLQERPQWQEWQEWQELAQALSPLQPLVPQAWL